jgi:cephalosporin hydroxylase
MKLTIDTEQQSLSVDSATGTEMLPLYSKEAFEVLSAYWVKIGWNEKYPYTFSWLGRPVIQLPEDMIRIQEVLYRVKPDVVIETGVAHGGSLIYYASLFAAMGRGRVVGVDIEIRQENRRAIEKHELSRFITLIEGDSAAADVVDRVRSHLREGDHVMVILDSNHSRAHVLRELEAYHSMVTPGSYLVATDGVMKDLWDVPRGQPEWNGDNPSAAALEFSRTHPQFIVEQPAWPFRESALTNNVTYWPNAWLRRKETVSIG